MQKLRLLFLFCALCAACRKSSANSEALTRYAKIDATDSNSFIAFYAQGLKLSAKTQAAGKMRAYFLSAMLTPDLRNSCAAWDCMVSGMQALDAKQRSGLYGYALYHLADFAAQQSNYAEAAALLAIATAVPPALERKMSLLRGRVLQLLQSPEVAAHFRRHAEKFTDAESLYFSAAALDRAGEKQAALELALRVLDKPEADSPFSLSGVLVRNMLGQGIYTMENTTARIRLMEALRIAKDRASALKLFQSVLKQKLSNAESLLFMHYGARLLIERNDFVSVKNIFTINAKDFLADGNDKPALDICERLLKKKQYALAEMLYAINPPSKARLQCQLRSAQRSGQVHSGVQKIAAAYISDFDGESTLAERIYLRTCLPAAKAATGSFSAACLEDLRQVTRGKPTGAAARYFLARHYDTAGEKDKAFELIREIAAGYADDFYFYRLIEKPLGVQKERATGFRAGSSRDDKLTDALLYADIGRARDIAPVGALVELEKDVHKVLQNLDELRQTALLLFAADSRDEARDLMRGDEKANVYKNLIALGVAAGKSDIALFGVKQWIREKKLRPFLFEIPAGLRDLLYPTTYSAHVQKYAAESGIEVAEVYALIRQESQFFPGAISIAKAQGLMQLLPSTAKLVAVKLGMKKYDLLKAEDNIRLGIGFMRDIKGSYTADYVGLAIAYNAGPGRFTQWKKKYSNDEDIFVEEIPFQETYQYVRVLLADRAKYRAMLTAPK